MPTSIVKSYADKYNISVGDAEKVWKDSLEIAEGEYGKPVDHAKAKKSKVKNHKVFGTAMNIFKGKMEKEYGEK